jgi:hypothetical protein
MTNKKENKLGCGSIIFIGFSLLILFSALIGKNETNLVDAPGETSSENNTSMPLAPDVDNEDDDDDLFLKKMKSGYPACISEAYFDEFIQAKINQDANQIDFLLNNACIYTNPKIQYSVVDTVSLGKVTIRVYAHNKQSVILWTNTEAVIK